MRDDFGGGGNGRCAAGEGLGGASVSAFRDLERPDAKRPIPNFLPEILRDVNAPRPPVAVRLPRGAARKSAFPNLQPLW